jgi:hypothetical protein
MKKRTVKKDLAVIDKIVKVAILLSSIAFVCTAIACDYCASKNADNTESSAQVAK